MNKIREWYANPKQRRQMLSIVSGGLIVIAWLSGRFGGNQILHDVLMIAAAVIAGSDIAIRAWNSLLRKHVSIELLVTIAAGGAIVIGEVWEAAAVTFLFIFGAYLEARTMSHTRNVLQSLLEMAPDTAVVLREGRQVELSPMEVLTGETVIIKPGSKIAVDGKVIDGRSTVDESAITGEPLPESKAAGAEVYAGTVNQVGLLYVEATGVGADTTLARIIRRVEEAQEEKAPTQRFIERFARWYTPGIIALSVLVFLISRSLELALTLLVIACPGALVISTPVSVVAGIGRGAKKGILIKGGEYLENAGKISAIALDKTGTLTEGRPRVTDVIALKETPQILVMEAAGVIDSQLEPYVHHPTVVENINKQTGTSWNDGQQAILFWAAVAETGSEHPLARAVLDEAYQLFSGSVPQADAFEAYVGKGIRSRFQGHEILVGAENLFSELGYSIPDEATQVLENLKKDAKTAIVLGIDGEATGILGISDPIRESSGGMVKELSRAGVKRILMLTGDDALTAQAIGGQSGIQEVHAGLLPEEKLGWIRKLQDEGHVVAMVGDGINDAPALAAADIGIAMGAAGADIAIETADIALMADDLMKVSEAVRLSKQTLTNIRQNLFVALATVSLLLAGVLAGEVHMAGGMLVHEASVLIVILNAIRLLKV